jgi:hypothetical protein
MKTTKIVASVIVFLGLIGINHLIYYITKSDINYFLDNIFPDLATDDLDLEYVMTNLPSYYWYFYYFTIAIVSVAIVYKNNNLLCISMLKFNVQIWILMRSNWEFSQWMANGSDYGGDFALLIIVGLFYGLFWLLLELFFFKEVNFMRIIRTFGVVLTVGLSVIHLIPGLYRLISLLYLG